VTAKLVIVAYVAVMALLSVHGIHRYGIVVTARAARRRRVVAPPAPAELPFITVQLPIYNELYVVERLLRAVAALDWPRDRLQIQLLDDSTDETTEVAARAIAALREHGHPIDHVRRGERSGFKAGALAAGLARARGELIAIFDADFVPPPSVLRDVVGHFEEADVGMVQLRWEHLNRDHSLLTRLQALLLDGHFLVDHVARAARGQFFNFNGTAGVWRRRAIEDAGGWQSDTLTEDLDLSYRAQLAGWRFVYRPDRVAPAELPTDMNAFKSQQYRWAKGSAQSAVKLLPALLRARLPLMTRLEAVFHLTGNFAYLLLLALSVLAYPALEYRYRGGFGQTIGLDLPFFLFGTLSVAAFYAAPLRRIGGGRWRWALVPALMALGIGMAVNNARAVLAGLLGLESDFRRTPKEGDVRRSARRYRVGAQLWVLLELALGVHFLGLVGKAISEGLWPSIPFLLLFATGFLSTGLMSLEPTIQRVALAARTGLPARAA